MGLIADNAVKEQIDNLTNEIDSYYEGVGNLFSRSRCNSKIYKVALTILTMLSTALSVTSIVMLTFRPHNSREDIAIAAASLVISIAITLVSQLRISENDENKALTYLQLREEAARLSGKFALEWCALQASNPAAADSEVIDHVTRLIAAKENIAIRAHTVTFSTTDR